MPAYNPPPQTLFSPVSNYYQGKAIRQQLAAGEQEAELRQAELDSIPAQRQAAQRKGEIAEAEEARKVAQELREVDGDVREKLYAGAKSAMDWYDENPDDKVGATEAFSLGYGDGAQDVMPGGDNYISPQEARSLVAAKDYEGGGGDRRTLSSEEAMALPGMTENRAANAVIQVDDSGEVFIDDAPTGITEGDITMRGGVNATGVSKNTIDFQDAVVGAVGAIQTGTELLTISDKNPESLGVPGGMMRFGANLVSGAKAIADWAGYEALDPEDTEVQEMGYGGFNYDKIDVDKLGVSGAEAEKFRAGIYGIAFAAAVAEQGTRPTDKDIQQFIDQVGGRATSAQSFRETIVQFMRRQDRRLNTIADVKQIGQVDRDAAFKSWKPAFRSFMETYAKTSGKQIATNPETDEKMIEISPGQWEAF